MQASAHWKVCNQTILISINLLFSQCQYEYSPRTNVGFGLWDGENLEQLWPYLRKFCKMMKKNERRK